MQQIEEGKESQDELSCKVAKTKQLHETNKKDTKLNTRVVWLFLLRK
jgi:hypothetical protein